RGAYVDQAGCAYPCDGPGRCFKEGAQVCERKPYTVTRMETHVVTKQVPYTVCKMVPHTVRVKVPYTVTECVPTTVCKRVPVGEGVAVGVTRARRGAVCGPGGPSLLERLPDRRGCRSKCGPGCEPCPPAPCCK